MGDAFGVRLNAGAEHIEPIVRDANGNRNVLALAGDWRASAATLVEAEIENSHRSQPSVPGFSLLGDTVPTVPDRSLNLNNQPWSLPVVFDATTGSLRVTQALNDRWRVVVHGLMQYLRTDDRVAFPFGCTDPKPPDGTYYPDRFCPNGTFDLYDFRSEDESRRSSTLDVSLHGAATHRPARARAQPRRAANDRPQPLPGRRVQLRRHRQHRRHADRAARTRRDHRRRPTATSARPSSRCATPSPSAAARRRGSARATRSSPAARRRPTARRATAFDQSFTTPFVALSQAVGSGQIVYASWGEGVESDVAPNEPLDASATPPVPRYSNAGQALPAAESRQVELGFKGGAGHAEWSAAAFDIRRPLFGDIGECGVMQCTRSLVGDQRHKGAEGNVSWRGDAWGVHAGAQWLHARVESPNDPTLDGKRPTNVPAVTARLLGDYQVRSLAGLRLLAAGSYESAREVLPDNSAQIPSVTKFDLGVRYEVTSRTGTTWTLRAGIDNVFDRRAWRESPYQFSHAYLFPLEPRTLRVSIQADL